MIELAKNFALLAIWCAMFLCIWRLFKGPKLADRILALDTLYTNSIAWLILEFLMAQRISLISFWYSRS